jgi:hypothetical protein
MLFCSASSYSTIDNFEIFNIAALASSGNGQTSVFNFCDGSEVSVHVQNNYVHGWTNPYFSVGTGDVTAGSYTVTNFVPYSYSPLPSWPLACITAGCWWGVQLQSWGGSIPYGNSSPTVSAISGSNPYSVTFVNTAGPATADCTGCLVMLGNDFLAITAGINGPTTDDVMQFNLIDGQDTAEYQLNPYADCGLSEGNNNLCVSSATADWRLPNIWRDNVIRNVASVAVAECSEWSGNLIENIRLSINPTAHTNLIECMGDNPIHNASLFYNNLVRHTGNPNPSTPTGRTTVGLGVFQAVPVTGEVAYIFNNVMYDTLENAVIERGSALGTQVTFNNSGDCGPAWSLIYAYTNPLITGDVYVNDYCATVNLAPIGSCTTPYCTNNNFPTPTAAAAAGYSESQPYAYSPPFITSPTVGAGVNLSGYCTFLAATHAAAGAACAFDTTYGASWNPSTHQVTAGARVPVLRPGSGGAAWDEGAYQFAAVSGPVANLDKSSVTFPAQLVGTTSATQTVTLSNSGSAVLNIASIVASAHFGQSGTCGATLAAGSSCVINVTFSPVAAGAASGSLTVTDNSGGVPGSTQIVALTGTGIAPVAGVAPSSLSFGSVTLGTTSTAQTVTVSNSGSAVLSISSIVASTHFGQSGTCGATLAAGSSCVVNVTFSPLAAGAASGSVTVTDNSGGVSGSTQIVTLSGTGVAPSYPLAGVSPSSLTFAAQLVGTTSAAQTVTLSNSGSAALAIASIVTSAQFSQSGTCGATLTGGASCFINVVFSPTAAGMVSGSLTVTDNSGGVLGSIQRVMLAGTGVAVLHPVAGLAPSSLTFAAQLVGTISAAQTVTLSNSGSAALAIASITASGPFSQSGTCGATLAAGSSCMINVFFSPTAAGAASGLVTVMDNSGGVLGSTQTVVLSGTGFTSAGAAGGRAGKLIIL